MTAPYVFSTRSTKQLETCHKDLQTLFHTVLKTIDCTILNGFRNKNSQLLAYQEGRSKVVWPDSNHNKSPSLAVDVVPYPIDWMDTRRFCLFAGFVLATAESLGVSIRWGGDWNKDWNVKDNIFNDLLHYEVCE